MAKRQLPPLTGLRFFLALWVVLFHQTSPDGALYHWTWRAAFGTGYVAVGIFFVLSGFVLSYNYSLNQPWSTAQVKRFAIARFARIYPAYAIGLLLTAPLVIEPVKLAKQSVVAALNFSLLQAWLPKTALTWNAPGWSLSNEAFFYACFPWIGVWLWRRGRFAFVLLWAAALLPVPFWPDFVKYNPLFHLADFSMGILACRAYQALLASNSPLIGRGYRLYLPAMILELATPLFAKWIPMPLLHNGLLLPVHVLLILGLALGGSCPRVLLLLGNASYSLYILHVPVMNWMNLLVGRREGAVPLAVYLALVIALSIAVFKIVEEPVNGMLRSRARSKTAETAPSRESASGFPYRARA